ncbi:MAG: hypothetical protein JWQ09_1164 [Segetibacter sp.]|nr:hypothetical protein [Segetibacter sp.]
MKREKLQQVIHLTAGIITLVYGFDSFEAGDFSSATYYLSLAIIFLIVAGSHKWISQKFMKADVAFYLLEAATIIYSGWHYKSKGHPYLFYIMAVAGTLYFIYAIISLLSEEKPKHRSRKRKRRSHSSSLFDEKKPGNDPFHLH